MLPHSLIITTATAIGTVRKLSTLKPFFGWNTGCTAGSEYMASTCTCAVAFCELWIMIASHYRCVYSQCWNPYCMFNIWAFVSSVYVAHMSAEHAYFLKYLSHLLHVRVVVVANCKLHVAPRAFCVSQEWLGVYQYGWWRHTSASEAGVVWVWLWSNREGSDSE